MKKIKNTFLFKILYPVHFLSWAGLVYFLINFEITWFHVLTMIFGWILIEGLGTAVILHRYISHRSIDIRPILKPFLLWLACMSLQGSPIGWAAVHRGSHHKFSDTERDAHSPTKGKWYAWHSWLYDWNDYFNAKYVIDLLKDPQQVWFSKNYEKIILVTYIVVGLISWELLLFGFMIPAAVGLYQESNINVFCHSGKMGYRNFETKDNSRNIPLLGYLTWGQGWHNNHHHQASSYDFGSSISGNRKEYDPTLLFVPLIATADSRKKIFDGLK